MEISALLATDMRGSEDPSEIPVNPKRSSVSDVRKALFKATGEEKWMDNDEWSYFLVRTLSRL